MTPSLQEIWDAVHEAYPNVGSLGTYNRRLKRNGKGWSQHAWENAWDITYPKTMGRTEGRAYLDNIYAFLAEAKASKKLPIHWIIWKQKDHYDHIHIEGEPKQTGIPPLREGEDMEQATLMIQKALNTEDYTDEDGKPLVEDGIAGPKTLQAFLQFMTDKTSVSGTSFHGVID